MDRRVSMRVKRTVRRFPCRAFPAVMMLTFASILSGQIVIDRLPRDPGASQPADTSSESPFAAVLHTSEEADTLMKRADEGLARQDWKLVVDSLQRIIELPGDHILRADDRIYESGRRAAQRRLAALPEAGLRAYRLVHDGEAAALLEEAQREHNEASLRKVVDRFLLTTVGADAVITLADWMMDQGQFTEAAALLSDARLLSPTTDLARPTLSIRAAVAMAASGQTTGALQLLDEASRSKRADAGQTDRIEHIRLWLSGQSRQDTPSALTRWPCNQGNGARTGRMDRVEAAFPSTSPWRVPLPIAPPREGFDAVNTFATGQGLWPAALPVTDGRSIYIKAGPRLLALDAETLETCWTSQAHAGDQVLSFNSRTNAPLWWVQSPNQPDAQYTTAAYFLRTYLDTVGSSIALAFDQILTVEWPGDPPLPPAQWREDGRPNIVQGRFDPGVLAPNRVAAYNPRDGKLLWSTDTAGGEGELAGLQFLAVPIPVGRYLVAPCRVQNDLYAVLLEPRTGRLARYIYLCGTGGGGFDSLHACDPCHVGGNIFIPTGRGILVALNDADFSLRWILRYDKVARKTSAYTWMTPQLVAAGDTILLAPLDADQLICIDRESAAVRWTHERGDAQYIVAADDHHVWLAGRQACAIDLATGRPTWSRQTASSAGRGALTGDRLYLPTLDGLLVLAAETGRPVDAAKPMLDDRLGNLLAFDFALYSIDALFLRKFPDLTRGYEQALALHKANPSDGGRAIRLAALDLFQNEPAKALIALDAVKPEFADEDPARHRHMAHLRVTALLSLAGSDATPPEKARQYFEQARRTALSPADAIRATLTLGEFYARQGRGLDACTEYLDLMLSEAGDEMLADSEGFEKRARDAAGQRLAATLTKLVQSDQTTFVQRARDRLRLASNGRDERERALLWISESDAAGDVAHEASLALAIAALESYRFEQAESLLTRVLRHADSQQLKAEAAARLAAVYLQPDELHQPLAASTMLDRLSKEFAAMDLPAAIADLIPKDDTPASRPSTDATIPASQLARALTNHLDMAMLARHREAFTPPRLGRLGKIDLNSYPASRPVVVRDEPREPLVGRLLLLTEQNQLDVRDVATGKLVFPVELRLLSELTVESQNELDQLPPSFVRPGTHPTTRARAIMDGQTLAMTTPIGLHAVGSLTGRRLWSRPFDPPSLPGQDPTASDAWLCTRDGYLVSVDARGRLEACRMESGNRILWRRSDPRRHWYWIRAEQGFVAAIDSDLERTDIFRLRDGGMIGTCVFAQPSDRVSLALFKDVICGPASTREIAAFELAAPGVQRWRFAMTDPLSQLFKPTPDTLAVADQLGRLAILDPTTGTAKWRTTVETCAKGVTDGVLQNDVLYVCGLQHRIRNPQEDYATQRWAVAALRWSDGQVLWQRGDLPARTWLNAGVLATAANVIPLATFTPARAAHIQPLPGNQPSDRISPISNRLELTLLDKATGQALGGSIMVNLPQDSAANAILDVRATPGALTVIAGANHYRFTCPPAEK